MPQTQTSKEILPWKRGSNYGGTCTISSGEHIVAANVDSDDADLIVKAVNSYQKLLDSNRELVQILMQVRTQGEWKSEYDIAINNAKNI